MPEKTRDKLSPLEISLIDTVKTLNIARCSQCKSVRDVKSLIKPDHDLVYGGWGVTPPSIWVTFNDCCGNSTTAIVLSQITICKAHIKSLIGK